MFMHIDTSIAQQMMKNWDRDYYSYDGMEEILNWYDEVAPDTEFDPISICCDWSEYGEYCTLSFDDLWNDYGEYEDIERDDDGEWIDLLAEELSEKTSVLRSGKNVIVMAF